MPTTDRHYPPNTYVVLTHPLAPDSMRDGIWLTGPTDGGTTQIVRPGTPRTDHAGMRARPNHLRLATRDEVATAALPGPFTQAFTPAQVEYALSALAVLAAHVPDAYLDVLSHPERAAARHAVTCRAVMDETPAATRDAAYRAARHCPTCDSPAPNLHPAMQYEGEVQPCADPWHTQERP